MVRRKTVRRKTVRRKTVRRKTSKQRKSRSSRLRSYRRRVKTSHCRGRNAGRVFRSVQDKNMHVALCFCVRDCEPYLKRIFSNIDALRCGLPQTKLTCIFVYDNCVDNSPALLHAYKQQQENVIVQGIENTSHMRTVRIAKARNACLEQLYKLPNVQYHMMIDSDDRCANKWNIDLIRTYLQGGNGDGDWDCISFNRKNYYDIWALLFDDFKHHCWGFASRADNNKVVETMRKEITRKLNNANNSIEVMSAFNGFAIYKTGRFSGFQYDGHGSTFMTLFTDDERVRVETVLSRKYGILTKCVLTDESCEHLFYHLTAFKSGRKIKISKWDIFL